MFSQIKQFKNYWFPSPEYIAESFWAKREIVFWRGFISVVEEKDTLPKEIIYDKYLLMIGLHYFGSEHKFHEVVFFEDFIVDKTIRSNINDTYPKSIKKAAELILKKYY
jgi:hypothetical protein